ncbi:MAG: metallophosphoesterase [Clostridia bacterium]|nr:metallophosphoesterase [Clostridia bacterium]
MKKILLFTFITIFLVFAVATVAQGSNNKMLICDENGDFTILIVSDPQCDTVTQWREARNELETLVKRSNPDFVMINGDMNSKNVIPMDMWDLFISPLSKRNIYWATTNGNHDPFKYKYYKMYKSYELCMNNIVSANDIGYDSTRPMNYVLPVYSNDGSKIVFAIYGMDSGTAGDGGYEGLSLKQIEWYKEQSNAFKKINSGMAVTSVLCMHIPLPQILEMYYGGESTIYGIANEINFNNNGYITQSGKKIDKINIHTSSKELDNNIFETILQQGDIKAVIFGHNHRNNFIGSYKGVLLGFAGKLSTGCYSDNTCRGGRLIKFNQQNPKEFTTCWLSALKTDQDQPYILSDGTSPK